MSSRLLVAALCAVVIPYRAVAVTPRVECERDCLELLLQLHEPMSAARLRRALEERGVGVWAGITVKRALARLHKQLRIIRNNRRGARGYWHPDAPSLFPRAAG